MEKWCHVWGHIASLTLFMLLEPRLWNGQKGPTWGSAHLKYNNTSIRMLFVDFSSAFNTVFPMKMIGTLQLDIGLPWIGGHTSSTLMRNTGAPKGCVLSPLLFMHPRLQSQTWRELCFEVCGRHHHNDETSYREEINNLAECCTTYCSM